MWKSWNLFIIYPHSHYILRKQHLTLTLYRLDFYAKQLTATPGPRLAQQPSRLRLWPSQQTGCNKIVFITFAEKSKDKRGQVQSRSQSQSPLCCHCLSAAVTRHKLPELQILQSIIQRFQEKSRKDRRRASQCRASIARLQTGESHWAAIIAISSKTWCWCEPRLECPGAGPGPGTHTALDTLDTPATIGRSAAVCCRTQPRVEDTV